MPKKPKFKPNITKVKLNPEQAVLACSCYGAGYGTGNNWYQRDYSARVMHCVSFRRQSTAEYTCGRGTNPDVQLLGKTTYNCISSASS